MPKLAHIEELREIVQEAIVLRKAMTRYDECQDEPPLYEGGRITEDLLDELDALRSVVYEVKTAKNNHASDEDCIGWFKALDGR